VRSPLIGLPQVRQAIEQYLDARPQAKDSLRGVMEWCRIVLGVVPPEPLVQTALDQLVADHRLTAETLADGNRVYGAARRS
jgi:hypothetical protein